MHRPITIRYIDQFAYYYEYHPYITQAIYTLYVMYLVMPFCVHSSVIMPTLSSLEALMSTMTSASWQLLIFDIPDACQRATDQPRYTVEEHTWLLMLGLHRIAEGLGTNLRLKNGQTRGYSGVGWQGRIFPPCYSPDGHNLPLNTRGNSDLLAIEIDKLNGRFIRQKRSWNLSISLASDPTHSWILLWSQVFAG